VTDEFTIPLEQTGAGKAWLRVVGDELRYEYQELLGKPVSWSFPLAGVGVVDLTGCPDPAKPVDDAHFADPLVLPSFGGGHAGPNLALLLAEPYRNGPADTRTSQLPTDLARHDGRARGYWVDGLLLRADKPALVARTLGEAGAQVVEDPEFWLSSRREVLDWRQISDEEIRYDPMVRRRNRNLWLVAGGVVFAIVGGSLTPLLGWVGGGVAVTAFVRAWQQSRTLTERGWRPR
jgi:hypothetical protein